MITVPYQIVQGEVAAPLVLVINSCKMKRRGVAAAVVVQGMVRESVLVFAATFAYRVILVCIRY